MTYYTERTMTYYTEDFHYSWLDIQQANNRYVNWITIDRLPMIPALWHSISCVCGSCIVMDTYFG